MVEIGMEVGLPPDYGKKINVDSQRAQILPKLDEPMHKGQTWYLIDAKWFKTFKAFVGIDSVDQRNNPSGINPGPIDNSLLIDPKFTGLKRDLIENLDYVIIPTSAWVLLSKWYGTKPGQMPIGRKVIYVGHYPNEEAKVEVYKVELKLYNNTDFLDPYPYACSQADKISSIESVCRSVFQVERTRKIRLLCYYGPNHYHPLLSDSTVYDESLDSDINIVMEFVEEQSAARLPRKLVRRSKEGSRIPRVINYNIRALPAQTVAPTPASCPPPSPVLRGQSTSQNYGSTGSADGRGPACTAGLSGLMNLGNTCFMNSIIQCLSNCPPITQYFLDGNHKLEINKTNPLGKGGQIAGSYADVISAMWSGKYSTTIPHYFKLQLTKLAPQFAGCQQHDAQELLTFLLDGLHEDLNRIKEKPYYQEENDQEDDQALARLSWEYFLRRNDSIIIDHFHGMLRSRVVCPDCEKVSTKFDTFSTLSLPLPLRSERTIVVRWVPYDQKLDVVDLLIAVPKNGTIKDMKDELSKVSSVKVDLMIITEISKAHFHKFFSDQDLIETIEDRDKIYMYDLPEYVFNSGRKFVVVPVVFWEVHEPARNIHFLSSLFGTPFFMCLPVGDMYFKVLYDEICQRTIRACDGFMKANINFGSFTMDCESDSENGSNRTSRFLFSPVIVSTYCYDLDRKIGNAEDDLFTVPEFFGRDLLALQVSRNIRLEIYKEPPISSQDHTGNFMNPPTRPTLEDCLNLFTASEKLGENNAWHCPRCIQMKRATKKLDLWKLPNILIFHLKRFAFSETRKEKLDTRVEFPLSGLDINHHVVNKHKENLVYDLIGVCNHYGSLMGGHYTAFCKRHMDGHWYCFDDNSVSPISSDSVQTENAYLLFYQRQRVTRANPDEEKVDF